MAATFMAAGAPCGPARAEQAILTVTDGSGARHDFDGPALERLPMQEIRTRTPWTDGVTTFRGPRLTDVLQLAGVRGARLRARALNDYEEVIPAADAADRRVILALYKDGDRLTVRTRGPLWIMYPFDADSALQNLHVYSRSVWQLRELRVLD